MNDDEDRRLLAEIARGDRAAFETFVRAHAPAVRRFVGDLVRDDGQAEETTSDVMVEVWRRAGTYGGRARARTWLFGIAHHKAIDAVRRRRIAMVPLDDLIGVRSDAPSPEDAALHADERARLERALGSLSPEHRAVLELTYVGGFAQAEIAEITGVPVATVKTRAFYAKQRLRDALALLETP